MAFTLPQLTYEYSDLEPHIDARTMEIHHSKHHQGYVDKLNAAVEGTDYADHSVEDLLGMLSELPGEIRNAVRNNGGGHANHSLFWEILTPGGATEPSGELLEMINSLCDDFATFKEHFSTKAAGQFGSGWGWLVVKADGSLEILTTPNQDSPISAGHMPILGIDVWEHAYYLNYQNKRADYLEAVWNIVNWDKVQQNYEAAVAT